MSNYKIKIILLNVGGIIIKKFILLLIFILPINIYASTNIKARIGNNYYDTLEDAIEAASALDTITILNDTKLDNTININKTININLNNNTIEADNKVFLISGGSLNLTGKGTIKETKPEYGAIMLVGSTNSNDTNYSTVNVGSDITLEGWSGIFINHNNKKSYGVLVNMNGTINAVDDINNDSGAGIYINGNIKDSNNSPIINLSETSKINSTGVGIYAAGYAIYNINGAYISGNNSALGIKSGIFNIMDGTIIGTGIDKTPTTGNNNGINPSGVAIQIESNPSYKGNIELNINKGLIESKHSNVIYEYTTKNSPTKVKNITLKGGTYKSNDNKDVFNLSSSFTNTHPKFITGGKYSSDPTPYLKSGYSTSLDNSLYEVTNNTMQTFLESNNSSNGSKYLKITITTVIALGIIWIFIKLKNKIII